MASLLSSEEMLKPVAMLSSEEIFRQLADVLAQSGYPNFLPSLVQRVAEILAVDYCLIAETSSDPAQAQTLALWGQGKLLDNIRYPLKGSPCETVPERDPCLYSQGVCQAFPEDQLLIDLGIESYLGMPILTSSGNKLGILCIMTTSPLHLPDIGREVLRIAAAQIGAELERTQSAHFIRKLTYRDTVTQLPNRAHLLETLQNWPHTGTVTSALGIVLVDICRFKEINDIFSFKIGDEVLQAVAQRLRTALPESCYIARYSADEFALITPINSAQELQLVCHSVQQLFVAALHCAGKAFMLDINLGCAISGLAELNGAELLRFASIALAEAKQSGQEVKFFEPAMSQALNQRQKVLEKFLVALRTEQLSLHYQPQFELASGVLSGAEALCRWHDAEWGWISPATFIPLAEERGLMPELGNWVMQTACRQLRAWQAQGWQLPGRLSINVSARQLESEHLISEFTRCSSGIAPEQIELEFTESLIMRNPEQSLRLMADLEAMGFCWAIDDFGTGYSSLAYLTRFRATTLKIDRAFISNIPGDHHHNMVVKTILAMANSLNMITIAEGVETAEQAAYLQQLGCDRAQGYWFGKPVSAADFAQTWLAKSTVK
ncbi:sensor domain-containing phosphodiesterase [Alishewanella tabrizica]|uniref:Uncharacterized protein n=1 Tax=Alishewanella tabrizica TaxID=671278 RepID=A0ABQ2WUG4_9ALTE|nr:sensor domain-containing phosphodiesterase [Alishewanella tabrizica]GGW71899.1 hypothetical protein GCM10008111_29970 [Alishewanella tabrizica]